MQKRVSQISMSGEWAHPILEQVQTSTVKKQHFSNLELPSTKVVEK